MKKRLCLCLLSLFFLAACHSSGLKTARYPIDPEDVLQEYLQALRVDDRARAGRCLADLSLLPMAASKPCVRDIGRVIREGSRWRINPVLDSGKEAAVFEVAFDEPDLEAFLSKLAQENLVAAMRSKGSVPVSERLCEIIAAKLAVISGDEIQALPRKTTLQSFSLKEVGNRWKITERTGGSE